MILRWRAALSAAAAPDTAPDVAGPLAFGVCGGVGGGEGFGVADPFGGDLTGLGGIGGCFGGGRILVP